MSETFCKSCGKKITNGKKDFCSEGCKKSLNVVSSTLFSIKIKKCQKCGKTFENKAGKFCSLECATSYSLIMSEIN